jgi:hypothetical protein
MEESKAGKTTKHDSNPSGLTRREAVTAGVVALAAGLAASAALPAVARASNGDTITAGHDFYATNGTGIINTDDGTELGNYISAGYLAGSNGIAGVAYAGAEDLAVGVWAEGQGGHTAFSALGKTVFSRSGSARISKKHSSTLITVPDGLTDSSKILCTLQNYAGAGVTIMYAAKTSSTRFKIQLSHACKKTAHLAWMIID